MNKTIVTLLLCSCALISFVQAQSKPNESKEPVSGRISFLGKAGDKITVKPAGGGDSINFKVNADTKVTLNGEASSLADLKKDWKVKVTPQAEDPATASTVEVTKGAKNQQDKEEKSESKE